MAQITQFVLVHLTQMITFTIVSSVVCLLFVHFQSFALKLLCQLKLNLAVKFIRLCSDCLNSNISTHDIKLSFKKIFKMVAISARSLI